MGAEVDQLEDVAAQAAQYAREGMPEAQYVQAQQQLDRQFTGALSAASSRGSGLNALGSLYGSNIEGQRNLASMDASMAQQNQGRYLNAMTNLAPALGQQEQYNKLLPYEQMVAEEQALRGAGLQNQYGALMFNYQNQMAQQQMLLDLAGGGISAGGSVAGGAIASDIRLKENVTHTGFSPSGVPTFEWVYTFDPAKKKHKGVIAQNLIGTKNENAVVERNGFYMVDYSKLDVDYATVQVAIGTLAFHEPTNSWSSFIDITPDYMCSMANDWVSFKEGELWKHNQSTRNSFYGQGVTSEITIPFNQHPNVVKLYYNIEQETNSVWGSATDGDVETVSGQTSLLEEAWYEQFQPQTWATAFRQDTSTPAPITNSPLLEGWDLRDTSMVVRLTNDDNTEVKLFSVNVMYEVSEASL